MTHLILRVSEGAALGVALALIYWAGGVVVEELVAKLSYVFRIKRETDH